MKAMLRGEELSGVRLRGRACATVQIGADNPCRAGLRGAEVDRSKGGD